ncbi:MAG: hypothetical protein R2712_25585 [Vicinamibacterales bacterium]
MDGPRSSAGWRAGALATVGAFDSFHRTTALAVLSLALVSMLVVWSRYPRARLVAVDLRGGGPGSRAGRCRRRARVRRSDPAAGAA